MAYAAEQIKGKKKEIVTPKERRFLKKARNKIIRATKIEKEPMPKRYDGWADITFGTYEQVCVALHFKLYKTCPQTCL